MSLEHLQRELDTNRAWRKLELSHARSLAENYRESAELAYLCRAWTMMIYAHCDQFIKIICKEYLKFLKETPRENYNYTTVWIAFFGKEAFKRAGPERMKLFKAPQESINTILDNISGKEVFSSGNFSYNSLRFFTEWVIQSPFDHTEYRAFCQTLKTKRDCIAHGEALDLRTVEDCLDWHNPAILLLDKLVDATIDVASRH